MIVHNTNNKIRETLSRLRNNHPAFINSNYPYVKETDHIEINALFGLMHLRELLRMNLQRADYLFADDGHYSFGATMLKIDPSFSLAISHLTTTLLVKTIGQYIVLPKCDQYGSCSIQTWTNILHQVNT